MFPAGGHVFRDDPRVGDLTLGEVVRLLDRVETLCPAVVLGEVLRELLKTVTRDVLTCERWNGYRLLKFRLSLQEGAFQHIQ